MQIKTYVSILLHVLQFLIMMSKSQPTRSHEKPYDESNDIVNILREQWISNSLDAGPSKNSGKNEKETKTENITSKNTSSTEFTSSVETDATSVTFTSTKADRSVSTTRITLNSTYYTSRPKNTPDFKLVKKKVITIEEFEDDRDIEGINHKFFKETKDYGNLLKEEKLEGDKNATTSVSTS